MTFPLLLEITGALVLFGVGVSVGSRFRAVERNPALEEERTSAIDELVLAVTGGGHDAVLTSLARQACRIVHVEKSLVVLRDDEDPRTSVVVAAHGVPGDFVGRRFGIDVGMFGEAMLSGKATVVEDYRAFPRAVLEPATADIRAGAAVPICLQGAVKGALTAATIAPGRVFSPRDLETLTRLAELGAVALEQAAIRQQLELAVESGVEAMAAAVDIRDSYTAEHSDEVVRLARAVGERLGLGQATLGELEFAARLHDVGKIGVPDAVLRKEGPLDDEEWDVMRQHPVWGSDMLRRIPGLQHVARVVRHGHERWDGCGYPDGLTGEQIPLESRIVFACDAYNAMTSSRPYRDALRPWIAVNELREGAGGQFDPDVVDALVGTLRERSGSASALSLFEAGAAPS